MVLFVLAQHFGTGTRYGFEIIHQCDKRIKTKNLKLLEANSYVCGKKQGKSW